MAIQLLYSDPFGCRKESSPDEAEVNQQGQDVEEVWNLHHNNIVSRDRSDDHSSSGFPGASLNQERIWMVKNGVNDDVCHDECGDNKETSGCRKAHVNVGQGLAPGTPDSHEEADRGD